MESANHITFEMPANDLIRFGLRFEYLKQLVEKSIAKKSEIDSIIGIETMIELLHLLDRPELRSKYFQEFSRFNIYLERLYNTQNIDHVKLHSIIERITLQMDKLNKHNGKFANELRESIFFKNILQFSDKPGALCGFNTPEYYLWLHQTNEQRHSDLKNWASYFDEISETNQILLHLIRGSGKHSIITANDGFHQQNIDPKTPCHLIQVKVSRELEVFPRISVGRHGISIIFLKSSFEAEAERDHRGINFELNICAL